MTEPVLETKVKDETLIVAIVENKRMVVWFHQYFFGDCLIFLCGMLFRSLNFGALFHAFLLYFVYHSFRSELSTTAISFLVAYGYFPLSILNVLFHPYFVIPLSGSCGGIITHFQVGVECFVTKTEHAKK